MTRTAPYQAMMPVARLMARLMTEPNCDWMALARSPARRLSPAWAVKRLSSCCSRAKA
jgi:hypothetical protein